MAPEIRTINLGGVNCYLLKEGHGSILIDTGFSSKRAFLEKELERAGVVPGNLSLILLTHGDSDHAENCVYLRENMAQELPCTWPIREWSKTGTCHGTENPNRTKSQ